MFRRFYTSKSMLKNIEHTSLDISNIPDFLEASSSSLLSKSLSS